MNIALDPQRLETLTDYAKGGLGTRAAIERLEFHDYADLIIALAQNDLPFPKPADSPLRDARIARAREILQPRLKNGS